LFLFEQVFEIDSGLRPDSGLSRSIEPSSECPEGISRSPQAFSENAIQQIRARITFPVLAGKTSKGGTRDLIVQDFSDISHEAENIVAPSLLRITEHTESLIYLNEFVVRPFFIAAIAVGMVPHRQRAIGFLYIFVGRSATQLQYFVIVFIGHLTPFMQEKYPPEIV
jgi:hypothetical protein